MPEKRGQVNFYVCHNPPIMPNLSRACGKITCTINLVDGTTPFMINCTYCKKHEAFSSMYKLRGETLINKFANEINVTHAFYRPDIKWVNLKQRPELAYHLIHGGLLLETLHEALDKNVDINFEGLKTDQSIIGYLQKFYGVDK